MKDERRADRPCPACGGRSYTWGQLRPQDGYFLADGASWWHRVAGAGAKLRARRCDWCGNLQVFTEPDTDAALGRVREAEEAARRDKRGTARRDAAAKPARDAEDADFA